MVDTYAVTLLHTLIIFPLLRQMLYWLFVCLYTVSDSSRARCLQWTALQEISFWLNLENVLNYIQQKRDSAEVNLTLDVLKAGKGFMPQSALTQTLVCTVYCIFTLHVCTRTVYCVFIHVQCTVQVYTSAVRVYLLPTCTQILFICTIYMVHVYKNMYTYMYMYM